MVYLGLYLILVVLAQLIFFSFGFLPGAYAGSIQRYDWQIIASNILAAIVLFKYWWDNDRNK